jgi:hypothetical protein
MDLEREPSAVQILAYFEAERRGRVFRMIPWRMTHHSMRGISITRGSDKNCSR